MKYTCAAGGERTHAFRAPDPWLKRLEPRWLLVLIDTDSGDNPKADLLRAADGQSDRPLRFSLHPWVVAGPDQSEEELLLIKHRLNKLKPPYVSPKSAANLQQ